MFFESDSFIYENIPFYGILGGILSVFFLIFTIYWVISELFID